VCIAQNIIGSPKVLQVGGETETATPSFLTDNGNNAICLQNDDENGGQKPIQLSRIPSTVVNNLVHILNLKQRYYVINKNSLKKIKVKMLNKIGKRNGFDNSFGTFVYDELMCVFVLNVIMQIFPFNMCIQHVFYI